MDSNITQDKKITDKTNEDMSELVDGSSNADQSSIPSSSPAWSKEGSQVQIDLIEWWCHELLQSTDPVDIQARGIELQRAVQTLGVVHSYGRLFNRIQMAGLTHLVCGRPALTKDDNDDAIDDSSKDNNKADGDSVDDSESSPIQPLSAWTEHQWRDLREQIILAKSYLLRCDANLLVLPFLGDELPARDDNLDSNRISFVPAFHEEYTAFLSLLHLHAVIARFRSELCKMQNDSHRQQNEESSKSRNVLLKKLEQIVDDYKLELGEVGDLSSLSTTTGEQQQEDSIYKSLTSFLLSDLHGSTHDSIHTLPQKLCSDLDKVLMKANQDDQPYSYVSLQRKWRWLAYQWCDKILDTPRLVQLGYNTPYSSDGQEEEEEAAEMEKCSVSSWGNSGEEVKEREETMKGIDDAIPVAEQQDNKNRILEEEETPKTQVEESSNKNCQDDKVEERKDEEEDEEEALLTQAPLQPVPSSTPQQATQQHQIEEIDEEEALLTQAPLQPVPPSTPQQATKQHQIEDMNSSSNANEELATQPIEKPPVSSENTTSEELQPEKKATAHESTDLQTQTQINTVEGASGVAVPSEPQENVKDSETMSASLNSTPKSQKNSHSKSTESSARGSDSMSEDITARINRVLSQKKRKKFTETIVEWPCSSDDESSPVVPRKQQRRRQYINSPLSLLVRKKKTASPRHIIEWPSSSDDEDGGKTHIAHQKASFDTPVEATKRRRSPRRSIRVQTAT